MVTPATPTDPHMLIVVDQHAAHERVRLETFTQGMHGIHTLKSCQT